jgi:hypothetical protein
MLIVRFFYRQAWKTIDQAEQDAKHKLDKKSEMTKTVGNDLSVGGGVMSCNGGAM